MRPGLAWTSLGKIETFPLSLPIASLTMEPFRAPFFGRYYSFSTSQFQPAKIIWSNIGADFNIAPDPDPGRQDRPFADQGNTGVKALRFQLVGGIVLTIADIAVGADYHLFIQHRTVHHRILAD